MLAMTPINVFDVLLVDDSLKKTNCLASFHCYYNIWFQQPGRLSHTTKCIVVMRRRYVRDVCWRVQCRCPSEKQPHGKSVQRHWWGSMAMRLAPTLVLNDGSKLITDVLAVVFWFSWFWTKNSHIYLCYLKELLIQWMSNIGNDDGPSWVIWVMRLICVNNSMHPL